VSRLALAPSWLVRSVSVVISSYNYGRYLADAVSSALNQSYSGIEVVVVDDGSSDDSREIARSFEADVHLVFKDNGGQASAWNSGFQQVTGEIVIFLDSDDRLLPDAAATAARAGMPGASKVHWRAELIDDSGATCGVTIPDTPLPDGDRLDQVLQYGFDLGPNVPSSANAWRRDFLQEVLPMPEEPFTLAPDTYLVALSPLYGSTIAIEGVHTQYRSHHWNNGAQGTRSDRSRDIVRRTEVCFDDAARRLARMGYKGIDVATWKSCNANYLRFLSESGNG